MDLRLSGARVVVTGAASGLGHTIAAALVAEGARVLACGLDIEDAPAGIAAALAVDLTEDDAPDRVVDVARQELGGLDVVLAVAGGALGGKIERCDDDRWAYGISLNLMSVVRLCRAAIPSLCESRAGRIVLFGAVSGLEPAAHNGIANVTKAGVHALTKTLSRELGRDGVLVNSIAPGRLRSPQVDRIFPDDEARRAYAEVHIPLARFGEPEEILPLTLLLASPVNTYITGQTIAVDGGMSWHV